MREAEIDASHSICLTNMLIFVGDGVQFAKIAAASWVLTWWPIHMYAVLPNYQIDNIHFGVVSNSMFRSLFLCYSVNWIIMAYLSYSSLTAYNTVFRSLSVLPHEVVHQIGSLTHIVYILGGHDLINWMVVIKIRNQRSEGQRVYQPA